MWVDAASESLPEALDQCILQHFSSCKLMAATKRAKADTVTNKVIGAAITANWRIPRTNKGCDLCHMLCGCAVLLRCPVNPPSNNGLCVAWASPNCRPWSPMGLRRGLADRRTIPYMVWALEKKYQGTHCIFVENSEKFPPEEFDKYFSQTHGILYARVDPLRMGLPMPRPHMLFFAYLLEAFTWVGPSPADFQQVFDDFFRRQVMLDADSYLADDESNRAAYMRGMLNAQGVYASQGADIEVIAALPPSARKFLQAYKDDYRVRGGSNAYVCDLQQNPGRRPCSGWFLRSLTTHGIRYSANSDKLLTPRDLWFAHGWPVTAACPTAQPRCNGTLTRFGPGHR